MPSEIEFILNTAEIDKTIKGLDKIFELFMESFKSSVMDKTPVDTGLLKASWVWERDGDLLTFSNLQDYAPYVEDGTPFMRGAFMVQTTIPEAPQILDAAAKGAGF